MVMIPLTPELFPDKPVLWMDDVGPVVMLGDFAFCCECESGADPQEINVWIYEKPDTLPDDPDQEIPKTRVVGKRNFLDEESTLHIQNFIRKFTTDESYRKDFMVAS
jgi:hypothetical protein